MWVQRWYGSGGKEGYEGWSIVDAETRELISYFGRDIESEVVTALVMIHNEVEKALLSGEQRELVHTYRIDSPIQSVSITCKVQE